MLPRLLFFLPLFFFIFFIACAPKPKVLPTPTPVYRERFREIRVVTNAGPVETVSFHYGFRDERYEPLVWEWDSPLQNLREAISRFGLPEGYFTNRAVKKNVPRERFRFFDLYYFNGTNWYYPDIAAVASDEAELTRPLAELVRENFSNVPLPTPRQVDHLLLAFCQDIPYKLPPDISDGKEILGFWTPAEILLRGMGDCDSKASLFLSIRQHLVSGPVLLLYQPNHVFLGVPGIPKPGEAFFSWKGATWLYAEPVGPARSRLGHRHSTSPFTRVREIELQKPGAASEAKPSHPRFLRPKKALAQIRVSLNLPISNTGEDPDFPLSWSPNGLKQYEPLPDLDEKDFTFSPTMRVFYLSYFRTGFALDA
ncbi:MAG: hypothetical protein JNM63_10095, partial [Spirochaetia bacterium]|nr:hypothetical protein [Spirochaetia bacterium]